MLDVDQRTWTYTPDDESEMTYHALANYTLTALGDNAYLFGGCATESGGLISSSLCRFSLPQKRWKEIERQKPWPEERFGHGAAVLSKNTNGRNSLISIAFF